MEKIRKLYHKMRSLWPQEQGNQAETAEIEVEMSANGQSVDTFSAVMGPQHPRRLRLDGAGVTKTTLKIKIDNYGPTLNATNDVVQQMQEVMQKMEKQMDEQKKTMRQEVMADVMKLEGTKAIQKT